jgi:hypothetical protein
VEGRPVRIIVQPLAGRAELCARLGLVLIPVQGMGGKVVHLALDESPAAKAYLRPRDVIFAVNGFRWQAVHQQTFSDCRSSRLLLSTFVARYFDLREIKLSVGPEPYRPIERIFSEALQAVAEQPVPTEFSWRRAS